MTPTTETPQHTKDGHSGIAIGFGWREGGNPPPLAHPQEIRTSRQKPVEG